MLDDVGWLGRGGSDDDALDLIGLRLEESPTYLVVSSLLCGKYPNGGIFGLQRDLRESQDR